MRRENLKSRHGEVRIISEPFPGWAKGCFFDGVFDELAENVKNKQANARDDPLGPSKLSKDATQLFHRSDYDFPGYENEIPEPSHKLDVVLTDCGLASVTFHK